MIEVPTIDVSSKEFYGEGYDDSDKRIPDMCVCVCVCVCDGAVIDLFNAYNPTD